MRQKNDLAQARLVSRPTAAGWPVNRLASCLLRSDRRIWPRKWAQLQIWVTLERSHTIVRTQTVNISSGGFYIVAAALDAETNPERREHVRVRITASAIEGGVRRAKSLVDCPATLVRREMLLDETGSRMGLGFEFNRPQLIDI